MHDLVMHNVVFVSHEFLVYISKLMFLSPIHSCLPCDQPPSSSAKRDVGEELLEIAIRASIGRRVSQKCLGLDFISAERQHRVLQ